MHRAGRRSWLRGVGAAVAAVLAVTLPAVAAEGPAQPIIPDEPDGYRLDDYRTPVPRTLKGARVVMADEAERVWKDKSAIFIDVFPRAPRPPNLPANTVWRDPTHQSVARAHWLPNVGFGALPDGVEDYYKAQLERLTGGKRDKGLVIFCLRNCWMSWNAAKRAMSYGYSNVMWFSDGTDGWQEIGNQIVSVVPEE